MDTKLTFSITFEISDYELSDRATLRTTIRNLLNHQGERGWPSLGTVKRVSVEDLTAKQE